MNQFISHCQVGLLVCSLGFLSACSDTENQDSSPADVQLAFDVPLSDHVRALPVSGLQAYLIVDNDGVRRAMSVDGTGASLDVALAPGSHDFTIIYEFTNTVGTFTLANFTKTMDISSGSNTVSYSKDEYVYEDSDGDGLSNAEELDVDNEADPTTTVPCELGTAIIGDCTLG